jgi:hypothetical protein
MGRLKSDKQPLKSILKKESATVDSSLAEPFSNYLNAAAKVTIVDENMKPEVNNNVSKKKSNKVGLISRVEFKSNKKSLKNNNSTFKKVRN